MEKLKVKSRVYVNQTIVLNGGSVKFVNGVSEISEELYKEIQDRKIPNIYKEGEEPEYRTKLEEQLRADVKEGNKEFEEEIARLKNIIAAKDIEISKKNEEIAMWKKAVEDLQKGVAPKQTEEPKESEVENPEEDEESDELKATLKKMKVDELKELAMSEDGGLFKEEELKGKKKEEIIEMILSK